MPGSHDLHHEHDHERHHTEPTRLEVNASVNIGTDHELGKQIDRWLDLTERFVTAFEASVAPPAIPVHPIHFGGLEYRNRDTNKLLVSIKGDMTLPTDLSLPAGFKASTAPLAVTDVDGDVIDGTTFAAVSADPAIATADLGADGSLTVTDPPGPGTGSTIVTVTATTPDGGTFSDTVNVTTGASAPTGIAGLAFGAPVPRDTP